MLKKIKFSKLQYILVLFSISIIVFFSHHLNFDNDFWFIFFLIGVFMAASTIGGVMINIAIVMYAAVVLFQIITLPVEFNASHRAMDYMKSLNMPQGEIAGSFSVLRACALTYVAAALASVLQLLYLLGARDN